jgi:hypothetical protein
VYISGNSRKYPANDIIKRKLHARSTNLVHPRDDDDVEDDAEDDAFDRVPDSDE